MNVKGAESLSLRVTRLQQGIPGMYWSDLNICVTVVISEHSERSPYMMLIWYWHPHSNQADFFANFCFVSIYAVHQDTTRIVSHVLKEDLCCVIHTTNEPIQLIRSLLTQILNTLYGIGPFLADRN